MRTPIPMRALLLATIVALPAAGRAETPDAEFAAQAASGSMMEVELGRYAAENAADPDVKTFGERMVRDHTEASEKLREAAGEAGFSLPQEMQPEHRKHVEQLTSLQGEEFDARYLSLMIQDHGDEIAEFTAQARAGESPIDRWAESTLPVLQRHLEHAQEIEQERRADAGGTP